MFTTEASPASRREETWPSIRRPSSLRDRHRSSIVVRPAAGQPVPARRIDRHPRVPWTFRIAKNHREAASMTMRSCAISPQFLSLIPPSLRECLKSSSSVMFDSACPSLPNDLHLERWCEDFQNFQTVQVTHLIMKYYQYVTPLILWCRQPRCCLSQTGSDPWSTSSFAWWCHSDRADVQLLVIRLIH